MNTTAIQNQIIKLLVDEGEEGGCTTLRKFACSDKAGIVYENRSKWCPHCKLAFLAGAVIASEERDKEKFREGYQYAIRSEDDS